MEVGKNIKVEELKADIAYFSERLGKLFIEKGELYKTGFLLKTEYILKIGKYQLDRYRLYYNIQKTQRKIAIYQAAINREEVISEAQVDAIIQKEIKEYEEELKRLTDDYNTAMKIKDAEKVSEEEYEEIKRLYRKIVKRIHPDLNPNLDEDFKYLWQETQDAYQGNDLEKLQDIMNILDSNKLVNDVNENEIERLTDFKLKLQRRIYEEKLRIKDMKEEFPYNTSTLLKGKDMIAEVVKEIRVDIENLEGLYHELKIRLDFYKDPQRGIS